MQFYTLFVGPYQMAIITKFHRHTTSRSPHTNTNQTFYCIHNNKKDYEHTTYLTHLKLIVKIKDHAYSEQLILHSQCVVTYQWGLFSVQKL